MKLIVVLLAVGLSASEKLNRGYLPPPGAKLAGGSSGDLQTPFELPKENHFYGSESNENTTFRKSQNQARNFAINTKGNKDANEDSNGYTQTTAYPRNRFLTMTSLFPEMRYNDAHVQSLSPVLRYPMKGNPIHQEGILESFGADGYYYRKPGNIPFITMTEGIMDNYHPKAFGMYGGNPMIIKSYSPQVEMNNMILDHNGNHDNHTSSDRLSGESYGPSTQKPDSTVTPLAPHFSRRTNIYEPRTARPVETLISSNTNHRSQARKTSQSRTKGLESDGNAVILNYENVISPDRYSHSFDTSNGIHIDESGTTVDGVKALGSFSYTGDDGKVYSVVYSADENGFQPRGDHLPTPPPIPEAIQKVIEQAKRDKEAGIVHDGSYDEEKYGHMKYQGPVNRYLQNMQRNPQPKNRNRDSVPKKSYKKPVLMKGNKAFYYQINRKRVQHAPNVLKRPVNNLNEKHSTRKVKLGDKSRTNPMQNLNAGNIIKYRRPVTYSDQNKNSNGDKNYDQQRIKTLQNQLVQSLSSSIRNKVANKFDLNIGANIPNINQVDVDENIDLYNLTIPQDTGYYYVPPRKIFVEGRFQDISPVPKEFANLFDTTDENIGAKSSPESEFYYIDQRDNNGKFPENPTKITSYFSNTEEPDMEKQTYSSNFYENTIQDNYQPDSEITSTIPTSRVTASIATTPKPYGNTQSTSSYAQDYTKDIDYQEETVFPEQRDENGVPFTVNIQDTANLSTTPMPSEIKYVSPYEASDTPAGFDTSSAKYLEHEGYYRVKSADLPTTFEDFPSSTNAPPFTDDGIQTEPIQNIKVDGFGRPIQDTQLFNANAPNNYRHFNNETPSNEESSYEPKYTATYDFGDKSKFSEADDLIPGVSDSLGLLKQESANIDDNENIIGEDFSGPKQPQRYDPETGYFY